MTVNPRDVDHPIVMGVLNVTPDSFSDGGRFVDTAAAIEHGLAMYDAGADVVDVGGESTRPGAGRVDVDVELARVLPVISELTRHDVPVSVDTTRSVVARRALECGATVVNDISGGLADEGMAPAVAEAGCAWILMHWRGPSADMRRWARYHDVVGQVRAELADRIEEAVATGVDPAKIVIDPGLGFAKHPEHNWRLSANLDQIRSLGYPVLIGASRKSYLGSLLAGPDGTARAAHEREAATVATSVLAIAAGAWGVRVHEVRATRDALAVLRATTAARAARSVSPAESTDRISLTGLRVRGHHGVYAFEREQGQDFVVDIELDIVTAGAAISDDIADTVHYGELADQVVALVGGEPVNLIETLAERVAQLCLADRRVAAARVTVHKPHAPISHAFGDVAVTVRRERSVAT